MNEYTSPYIVPSTAINSMQGSNIVASGTMIAKEFKIAKDPNMFYEYEMRVLDLCPKDALTDDRCLAVYYGTVELPGSVRDLKEVLTLKHMKELSEIVTDTPLHLLTIDVKIVYQAQIKD